MLDQLRWHHLAIATWLMACGSETIIENETTGGGSDGTGGQGGTTVASGGSAAGGEGGEGGVFVPATIDCGDVCAQGTPDGGCLMVSDCQQFCDSGSPSWVQPVADAFASCATEEFLCFETLDHCMWNKLYPVPFDHQVTLTAAGLGAYEGNLVTAAIETTPNQFAVTNASVHDGSFELSFDVTKYVTGSHLVMVYVEHDLDGQCTAADFVTSSNITVSGDWLAPAFTAHIDAATTQMPFVCDYMP